MGSPRCGCGYETKVGFRSIKRPARPEDQPISIEAETRPGDGDTATWRSQLDKKFESARETFEDIADFESRVDQLFARQQPGESDYLEDLPLSDFPDADLPPLASKEQARAAETPVASEVPLPVELKESIIDAAVRPAAGRLAEQKRLTLQPLVPEATRGKAASADRREAGKGVPREVIFSRILAGIVDLLLPMLLAILFVFVASWFLRFDFFSPSSTRAWVALALILYFLNSLYFFWTAGQTPGMHLTELQLVDQEDEEPTWGSVLFRIVLFLPILLTVVGLVLALFDSECRALHDRLSGTKIIPVKA